MENGVELRVSIQQLDARGGPTYFTTYFTKASTQASALLNPDMPDVHELQFPEALSIGLSGCDRWEL